MEALERTLAAIGPADAGAMARARAHQDRLTKPRGALGELEDVAVRLAGIAGVCPPPLPVPAALAIFAADHGVHAHGVSRWPQEVTAQMVANFVAGGAVANAFAAHAGASVTVVDVGVASDLPESPRLLARKVAYGTADLSRGPAMSAEQALAAVGVGVRVALDLVDAGAACLVAGDMGIANTTASAALICAFTGRDAAEVTGGGAGADAGSLARKIEIVRRGLEVNGVTAPPPAPEGPDRGRREALRRLAAVGGLEHAAITGFVLAAAASRVPVILDGVIAGAAALAAAALAPAAVDHCVAGHRSAEPGHAITLGHLGLRPLVDLELRLGEGTGALLAYPLVGAAVRVMHEVATFDSAGVTGKDGAGRTS
ncbi:nicotinate-nucleotide--dimethylbenzimidazole phosphoribosyltransferase [Sphaerisporangium album]|uniref:Nicotinate-nucleotide--dimethylbenzimidazole phosphoribosyltransferase n=2 Tax=Sphaerisporangium album TaxID=509200 RepID=A0A367F1Y4_9ACTN|nr:nicotinate-nucleotide--dimethylbenzimidazole phosphoribosyltransferase [Sphaerisporangium album]RCG23490.1 nicotinate-nucleotide--dimethylbenzimidazole phosphoribosyltransferase [Sphaerisporangium album]